MKIVYMLLVTVLVIVVAGLGAFLNLPVDNDVKIELLSDPYPLAIGPIDFMVSVTDGGGRPIEDANVHVTTQYTYDAPITYTARQYENEHYHLQVMLTLIGQITITVNADVPGGETVTEEFVTFVYAASHFNLEESQPYRSEREIEQELANVPENEYWIVVPHGAQEISGCTLKNLFPHLFH